MDHNLWCLSDEAYWDIRFEAEQSSIVSLPGMKDRTCILYTFSKSFSMVSSLVFIFCLRPYLTTLQTGWRLGAAIGPAALITHINKINTNDEACTTHFIQYAGLVFLSDEAKAFTQELVAELKKRRDIVCIFPIHIGLYLTRPRSLFLCSILFLASAALPLRLLSTYLLTSPKQ